VDGENGNIILADEHFWAVLELNHFFRT